MLDTQTEFAAYRGVSQPTVFAYIKSGKIPKSAMIGKKIDRDKADAALEKNLSPMNRPQKNQDATPEEKQKVAATAGMGTLDYQTAHTLNEQYKAALKKLEYDERSGKVVNADEVKRRAFTASRKIRDACLAIADRCHALVAAESDPFQCKQILMKEINFIMENLSETVGVDEV